MTDAPNDGGDFEGCEMSNTFIHSFGGWKQAEARRWKNPDGSAGGIVAVSATVEHTVTIPVDCVVWPEARIIGPRASIGEGASIGGGASIGEGASIGGGASIGEGASIGPRASIEKEDWLFVAGPQGSRNAWATAIYSQKEKALKWWIGCRHGLTTDEFKVRLEREHPAGSNHRVDYEHLISSVESHPGLARARAAK
jgi:hypothetical protein